MFKMNPSDVQNTGVTLDTVFDAIKECYFNITNKNLPIYVVAGSLKYFKTTKGNAENDINVVPADEYRDWDEDLFEPLRTNSPVMLAAKISSYESTAKTSNNESSTEVSSLMFAQDEGDEAALTDFVK